jgi:glycosyltransferase involved in cell wall biosynthesis
LDKRIKILNQENSGLNIARKNGLRLATGELIFFIDGDDFLEKDGLEKLLQNMVLFDSDMAIGGFNCLWAKDLKFVEKTEHTNRILNLSQYLDSFFGKGSNTVCMKLYKKTLFNGILFPPLMYNEDKVTSIQILANANRISFCDAIVYNYLVDRKGSIMNSERKKITFGSFEGEAFIFEFLKNNNELKDQLKNWQMSFITYLYRYTFHHTQCTENHKKKIIQNLKYIDLNQLKVNGFQNKIMVKLIKRSFRFTHYFIRIMQLLKPTIQIHLKY